MKSISARALFLPLFLCCLSSSALAGQERPDLALSGKSLGGLPLYFLENQGQVDDERVGYYVEGADKTLYFTPEGITFAQSWGGEEVAEEPRSAGRWVTRLEFLGARPEVEPVGEERQPTTFSYFRGRPQDWRTSVPAFTRVVYRDLWPGIDLVYSGTADALKYAFEVHPGADPDRIRLAYRGVSGLTVNEAGELCVSTPAGGFEDALPVAWQTVAGKRQTVSMSYALDGPAEEGVFPYHFELGEYDPTQTLVLDPAIVVYCGYIGGVNFDEAYAVAVDGTGRAYVTGISYSDESSFPTAVGPDLTANGSGEVFVARVNPQGTGLEYCGYLGGAGQDHGSGIAVDAAGRAYLTGYAFSDETDFPVTVGPDLTQNGGWDAFVARLNAQGTALEYCGFLGGVAHDYGHGIAVDAQGNAYITGQTFSDHSTFPVTVGPDLTFNAGIIDAFVARVNAQGTGLDYCGYLGGANQDSGMGIAVDGQGRAYVTGTTYSDESTFPVVVGPDLTHNGSQDLFVARVNAPGAGLDYGGYIGGTNVERVSGIAVDGQGNAYVTGDTTSDESSFPVLVGPDLTLSGTSDAFVAKVSPLGAALIYCGYLGGSGFETGAGIAVDLLGNAYLAGYTTSDGASFPVLEGPDLTFNGGFYDAFVARVNVAGDALDYCGYLGGSLDDYAYGIAVEGSGDAYVVGATFSDGSSFPVSVGPDLTYNGQSGNQDAFVAKVEASLCSSLAASETIRLGTPPNPSALVPGGLQGAGPLIGATWRPRIDHTSFAPGATLDLLIVDPRPPINVTTSMGTLLCNLPPATRLFSKPAGTAFSIPIPADCAFVGLGVCSQGGSVVPGAGLRLVNALDLVVGTF